ncbi:MAG: PAC2 family protein [Actinobacteria bacterium]|nr:PAC2 family protein [Actinomycetota bacterium]
MEILNIPALRNPRMIIAFTGWNDAGEAASGAVEHLLNHWQGTKIAEMESEEFYDFQVNRPQVSLTESKMRTISWPTTSIFAVQTPHLHCDFVLVQGPEPSLKWKSFVSDLLDLADDLDVQLIVTLGALLADVPHSRSIQVTGSAAHPEVANRLGMEISHYQGPTGILGVIQEGAYRRAIDCISFWSALPHYASASPSPKATLALINSLEDFLEISIPLGDLHSSAQIWESDVDELAEQDSDIAEYVKQLEDSKDAQELPEATGDEIAREFERYLRRKSSE